jgi:integrase
VGRTTKLQIKKRIIKQRTFFQVTIPKPGGGRDQRTFKDEGEAQTFFELKEIELRNRGTAGVSMSDQIRGDALSALEILKPLSTTLVDAAKFFADHHEKLARSESVQNAVNSFLVHKEPDSRHRYFKDLRLRLGRFCLSFRDRKLADISAGEIQDWANSIPNIETGGKLSPRSRNTYVARVSALLSYSKDRGWVTENVLNGVKKAKTPKNEEVGILTTAQADKLLVEADKRSLPYFAIGLFAGLRTVELQALDWSSIHWDEKEIEVKSWTSKTGSKRFVPMKEPLISWLQPYRGETGRIFPGRKTIERNRAKADLLKDWPDNALRHSYASYSLAHFKDSARLSMDLGQTDPKIVFENYHRLVRPAAGVKFWSLMPKS